MNRRLWSAVGITVTVLSGVSFVVGPGQFEGGLRWLARVATAGSRALAALPWPVVVATAALAAGVGAVVYRAERRRRGGEGEPWRTVIELGKQGQSASAIARKTGLPQDAVRIVLAPVAVDPAFPRGNSFRSSSPTSPQHRRSDSTRRQP